MTFYIAEMESEHFTWQALGRDEDDARRALAEVWERALVGADVDEPMTGAQALDAYGVNVWPMTVGVGYRDGEPVFA